MKTISPITKHKITLKGTSFDVHWDDEEFVLEGYDIDDQEIAEIISQTYPGPSLFFKVARRLHKQLGRKNFEEQWQKLSNTRSRNRNELGLAFRFVKYPKSKKLTVNAWNLPVEVIQCIMRTPDKDVVEKVFTKQNLNFTPELLDKLWKITSKSYFSGDTNILAHPNVSSETLERIVREEEGGHSVKAYVSVHPNTNSQTLEILAQDNSLLQYIARHKNTPVPLLRELYARAKKGLQAKGEVLDTADIQAKSIFASLAFNGNTPHEILEEIVALDDPDFHECLLRNPSLSDELVLEVIYQQRRNPPAKNPEGIYF